MQASEYDKLWYKLKNDLYQYVSVGISQNLGQNLMTDLRSFIELCEDMQYRVNQETGVDFPD